MIAQHHCSKCLCDCSMAIKLPVCCPHLSGVLEAVIEVLFCGECMTDASCQAAQLTNLACIQCRQAGRCDGRMLPEALAQRDCLV